MHHYFWDRGYEEIARTPVRTLLGESTNWWSDPCVRMGHIFFFPTRNKTRVFKRMRVRVDRRAQRSIVNTSKYHQQYFQRCEYLPPAKEHAKVQRVSPACLSLRCNAASPLFVCSHHWSGSEVRRRLRLAGAGALPEGERECVVGAKNDLAFLVQKFGLSCFCVVRSLF